MSVKLAIEWLVSFLYHITRWIKTQKPGIKQTEILPSIVGPDGDGNSGASKAQHKPPDYGRVAQHKPPGCYRKTQSRVASSTAALSKASQESKCARAASVLSMMASLKAPLESKRMQVALSTYQGATPATAVATCARAASSRCSRSTWAMVAATRAQVASSRCSGVTQVIVVATRVRMTVPCNSWANLSSFPAKHVA